jgi:hypothetical protein
MASLSVERAEGFSFYGTAFDLHEGEDASSLLQREEEFGFAVVPFQNLDSGLLEEGIVCTSSTDSVYIERWGSEKLKARYGPHGIESIWDDWNREESGILPCSVYLRHVYLAAKASGTDVFNSLLQDTYLVDRVTTIADYVKANPEVITTLPPESLLKRYNG